jgi:hypothetical protein
MGLRSGGTEGAVDMVRRRRGGGEGREGVVIGVSVFPGLSEQAKRDELKVVGGREKEEGSEGRLRSNCFFRCSFVLCDDSASRESDSHNLKSLSSRIDLTYSRFSRTFLPSNRFSPLCTLHSTAPLYLPSTSSLLPLPLLERPFPPPPTPELR